MINKFILIIVFIISYMQFYAQAIKKTTTPKIYFSSHIGIGLVKGHLSSNVKRGFQAMTGIEYKFNNHTSVVGELNFDGYSYKKTTDLYSIDGLVNNIPLTLFYKYTFGIKKWLPYTKFGLGSAKVTVPLALQNNNFTIIKNSSIILMQFQTALGLNYEIKKGYLSFIEVGYQQFGKNKLLYNKQLNVLGFKIGIATAL